MRKLKAALCVLSSMLIIAASHNFVHAEDMTRLSSAEAIQITAAIKKHNSQKPVISVVPDDMADKFTYETDNYDIADAYKIHILKEPVIAEYKSERNFRSLITDDTRIMLPTENKLITFGKKGQVYEWYGEEYTSEALDFNRSLKELLGMVEGDVLNIIHTYSYYYQRDIVYIETTEHEYAVMYSQLDSGVWTCNIGSPDECFDSLAETFSESDGGYEGPGDINSDGRLDLTDLLMLAKYLVGRITLTEENLIAADYDGDGTVGLMDAIGIARYIVSDGNLNGNLN